MADLEAMGYLTQPHTSAGRIPTELGYRLYVEALIHQYSITKAEIQEINEQLHYKLSEMGEILSEISRIAAQGTNYTGLALRTGASRATVNRFMSVYLSPRDFMLVMSFKGDTVKSKTVHLSFAITEHTLSRFTDALNLYLSAMCRCDRAHDIKTQSETGQQTAIEAGQQRIGLRHRQNQKPFQK